MELGHSHISEPFMITFKSIYLIELIISLNILQISVAHQSSLVHDDTANCDTICDSSFATPII